MGKRHLRILYDILIDPTITTKTKNNGFLRYVAGRKYLQSLQEITNFRVFCKGTHKMDRIEGTIQSKNITKHQIRKFNQDFKSMMNTYQRERKLNHEKYKKFIIKNNNNNNQNKKQHQDMIDLQEEDDADDEEEEEEEEEEENEIRLSLNIKNSKNSNQRSFKHEISIDSNNNNHEISIHVKSKSKSKKRKLSHLDRLHERNPTKKKQKVRRRSSRLSHSKDIVSDDDD